ncbi:MAG: hypothetical protein J0H08_03540, partial [Rhizobiales bacterium]|nr:hypothetical protein [Hyphomicrobiales bacterium]
DPSCLTDGDQFICLTVAESGGAPGMGLAPGHVYAASETPIPAALADPAAGHVTESDGRATLLTRLSNRRGHDLGWIGLSLPPGSTLPDPGAVSARITALFETHQSEDIDA